MAGQKVYAGMRVPKSPRLKQLEQENTKLKQLAADLTLDNVVLKDLLARKW